MEPLSPAIGTSARWRFLDRKSTRLNSSHGYSSYAVFCLKTKTPATAPGRDAAGPRARGGGGAARPGLVGHVELTGGLPEDRELLLFDPQTSVFFNDTAPTEIYTLSLHALFRS